MTTDAPLAEGVRPASGWRDRLRSTFGEPGSPRRVIVRNGAWEASSYAVYAAVVFFLSPFVVQRLGSSLYGIWEIVLALTAYLQFADLGVRPAAVHFIARHDARDDAEAINRFVSTAFLSFAGAGLIVLLLAGPLAYALPRFWRIAPGFEQQATWALLIVVGELALTLPLNAFSAVLVGKQRYDVLGRVRLALTAARTAAIVIVLSQGLGLISLALVVAGSSLVEMVWLTVEAFRTMPGLRLAPRLATRDAFRGLIGFGGWATLVVVAYQVTWATDPLVIGRALSPVHVAYFAIGFKLALSARDLLGAASRVTEPAAGALFGRGDREGIVRMLSRGGRIMLLLAAPIVVYLLVAGTPFLRRWMGGMGSEYAASSGPVLAIMALAVLPVIASGPLRSAHYGTNRVRPLALLLFLEAGLNILLSVLLVRPYGIVGVALGTTLPAFLVHGVLLPLSLCRAEGLSWWRLFSTTWTGPVVVGVVGWSVLRLFVDPQGSYGWPALFALAATSVLLHLLVTWAAYRLVPAWFAEDAT